VGEKKQQNNLKLNLLSHGFSNKTNTTFHGRERAFWTFYSLNCITVPCKYHGT